jgi:hypothetical protein
VKTKFGILQNEESEGCKCPAGFKGDGVKRCEGDTGNSFIIWSYL